MALILNIDTAITDASVCIAKDGVQLGLAANPEPKDHAAWIHEAIRQLLYSQNLQLSNLDAIALSAGPGSYTGLRVGMATAKGICYGLNIPLITIGTLYMMANAATDTLKSDFINDSTLLCPMIDARRMEVFTAIYDTRLNEVMQPRAVILDSHSFSDNLSGHTILFFGNGSLKFKSLVSNPSAIFSEVSANAGNISAISYEKYQKNDFADLIYSEPFYLKGFYTHEKKPNV